MEAVAITRAGEQQTGDDRVVARARDGDLPAFEELYRREVKRVYATVLRMTGNASRAEELTQEAFVRAWERLRLFRGGSFGAWLRRLAVNVVLDEYRARRRRNEKEHSPEAAARYARSDGPSTGAIDLERAVALLPPRARRVFVLHDIEGYRHDEVARMLGVAVGTSKAQLHRARKLLRETL